MQRAFQIVGVLNTTPDSYHDGGRYVEVGAALKRVEELLAQGADIIEVGGESTGPNSKDVSQVEEIARTIPVIQAVTKKFPQARVSIDTYKSAVAEQAIDAGVMMVNDVTAGRSDPKMFDVVGKANIKLVLMFSKDALPRTTIAQTQYDDVVKTISNFLSERKQAAIDTGVQEENIFLDPGMGHFISSDPKYSFEVLARLREFQALGCPLFLSPSRKSFLAGRENLKTADRLPGTITASAIAVLNGASYIRTHDVLEVKRACEISSSMKEFLSP